MTQATRRTFLRKSASTLAVFAAPMILPRRVFGANDRIAVAAIGVRNQGAGNVKRFLSAGADVVAICDVDSKVAAAGVTIVAEKAPAPSTFSDYRLLLEEKGIDAVVITTPDHWHAKMTIDACAAGKDVYCEKPLTLTIGEGRRMVNAARQHKRIVQTGSQQRSSTEFWQACMMVRNGMIGDIKEVLVGIPAPNHPGPIGPVETVPEELNYDMWLGPAPEKPYHSKRVHYNFRFWRDYSGGQITNMGAHHLDIAQWGLGMDESGPTAVEGTAEFHPEMIHEVTEKCRIVYTYASGVKMTLGQGQADIQEGTVFVGSKGAVTVNRGKLVTTPMELANTPLDSPDLIKLYRSTDHTTNFLDCMQSRELPVCDVEIGHRSATVCHLGNLAAQLGRPITWDPVSESFPGDPEAQALTDRPYRSPWA